MKSWERVYSSYKKYHHCDDGAISEGYSDKICNLMAHNWQHIDVLNKIIVKDKKFSIFVMNHIDDTVDVNEVRKIFINSSENCPPGSVALCKSIIRRICRLDKEINDINGNKEVTKWSILNKGQ